MGFKNKFRNELTKTRNTGYYKSVRKNMTNTIASIVAVSAAAVAAGVAADCEGGDEGTMSSGGIG